MIDWTKWWEEHPQKYNNDKMIWWANLRPEDYSYKSAFKFVDKHLKLNEADYVLDAGCGTGELSELIGSKVSLYVGVDFSSNAIKIAQERHPKYLFTRNPLHGLDFINERFNKVFSMGVWQYIPHEYAHNSVEELLRVVSPGGKILIGDVLAKSDPAAEVYDYPKEFWQQFNVKNIEFLKSSYEPKERYDVLITR